MKKLAIALLLLLPNNVSAFDEETTYQFDLSNIIDEEVNEDILSLSVELGTTSFCFINDKKVKALESNELLTCHFDIGNTSYVLTFNTSSNESQLTYERVRTHDVEVKIDLKWDNENNLPIVDVSSPTARKEIVGTSNNGIYFFNTTLDVKGVDKRLDISLSGDVLKVNQNSYHVTKSNDQVKLFVEYFVNSRIIEPNTVWNATETYKKSFYDAKQVPYSSGVIDQMLKNNTSIELVSKDGNYRLNVPLSQHLKIWDRNADGSYQETNKKKQVIFQWHERNLMNHQPDVRYYLDDSSMISFKFIDKVRKKINLDPEVVVKHSFQTRVRTELFNYRKNNGFIQKEQSLLRKFTSNNYDFYPLNNAWTTEEDKSGYDRYKENVMYLSKKKTTPNYSYYNNGNWTEHSSVYGYEKFDSQHQYVSRKLLQVIYDYYPSRSSYTNTSSKSGWDRYTSRTMKNCQRTFTETYLGSCVGKKWSYRPAIRIVSSYGGGYAICPSGWRSYYSNNFKTHRCRKYHSYTYDCQKSKQVTQNLYNQTPSCPSGYYQISKWKQYRFRKVSSREYAEMVRMDKYYEANGYKRYYETHHYKHRKVSSWNYTYKNQVGSPYAAQGYVNYQSYPVYRYRSIVSKNYQYASTWLDVGSSSYYLKRDQGYEDYSKRFVDSSIVDYAYKLNQLVPPHVFIIDNPGFIHFSSTNQYSVWSPFSSYQLGPCRSNTNTYNCLSKKEVIYPTAVRDVVVLKENSLSFNSMTTENQILNRAHLIKQSKSEEEWAVSNQDALYDIWLNSKEYVHSKSSLGSITARENYLNSHHFKPYIYLDKHWRAALVNATSLSYTGHAKYIVNLKNNYTSSVPLNATHKNNRVEYVTKFFDESIDDSLSKKQLTMKLNKEEQQQLMSMGKSLSDGCHIIENFMSNVTVNNASLKLGCVQ